MDESGLSVTYRCNVNLSAQEALSFIGALVRFPRLDASSSGCLEGNSKQDHIMTLTHTAW